MDPRRLLPALALVAGALVVATAVVLLARPDPAPPLRPTSPAAASPARTGPAAVLAAWDQRRAAAWAAGDPAALRRLYVAGARAGVADVRLLRDYLRRGLRVEGLRTQVLALRVALRAADRIELVVTDRVVGAEAVGAGGRVVLPVARPATRRVVLVRAGGRWLVADVRAQESAAASTSRTSSSSKS